MTTATQQPTQTEHRTTLRIVYRGPAMAAGSMESHDLAEVTEGIRKAIVAADYLANQGQTRVQVRVEGIRRGSFEIIVEIIQFIDPLIEITRDIVPIYSISRFLFRNTIGRIKTRNAETGEETSADRSSDSQPLEIQPLIEEQYRDPSVRSGISTIYNKLEQPGIESVQVVHNTEDSEGQDVDEILDESTKDDLPSFLDSLEGEGRLSTQTLTMWFSIVQLPFRDSDEWRLTDGSATFTVKMRDKSFESRVQRNLERFASSDRMQCTLEVRQWRTEHGVRTEYDLLEVIDHPPPEPL